MGKSFYNMNGGKLECKVESELSLSQKTSFIMEVAGMVVSPMNMLVVCGAIPGPKGGLVTIKSTVKVHKVKQAGADISKNPQKASGRNPQKASARNK